MAADYAVCIQDLTKTYGTCRALDNISLELVLGKPVYENICVLEQICYIEEKGYYDKAFRILQILKLAGGLYPNWDYEYAERLLTLFELDKRKQYKQLSRGMESSLSTLNIIIGVNHITVFQRRFQCVKLARCHFDINQSQGFQLG